MKRLLILIFLLLTVSAWADDDEMLYGYFDADLRSFPVNVTNPNGTAAAGSTITLYCMDRYVLPHDTFEKLFPERTWITDKRGSATVTYPTWVFLKGCEPQKELVRRLYLVIAASDSHSGVIRQLHGRKEGLEKIHLNAGYSLLGKVLNQNGKPVKYTTVTLCHDLHANTHTGYGGEILKRSTLTDAVGDFRFDHVNSAPITIDGQFKGYSWTTTTINGIRYEDRKDELDFPSSATEARVILHLEKYPVRVYQGKVLDDSGEPVRDAKVTIGYSYHAKETTYADSHAWDTTSTAEDGSWTLGIPTPWATWGNASISIPPTADRPEVAGYTAKVDITTTSPQTLMLALRK